MFSFDRRSTMRFTATGALLLSASKSLLAAGRQLSEEEALKLVDPELLPGARKLLDIAAQNPSWSNAALPGLRSVRNPERPMVPGMAVVRHFVPVAEGESDVPVYVINPAPGQAKPCIFHTHGGGFIRGTAEQFIPDLQHIAKALDCVIVSADYRLAPETRYTGSVADNYAALKWAFGNARSIGIDQRRIAIMGESAGGGHAALITIMARDRGEVPITFQCLTYPMLDDRTGTSRPVAPQLGRIGWSPDANRFAWGAFLGQKAGTALVPREAVPARTADLGGLPPAWIGVGALDLFVGEDIEYAHRLIDAGIATDLIVVPGAYHGFERLDSTGAAAVTRRFTESKLQALRRAFAE